MQTRRVLIAAVGPLTVSLAVAAITAQGRKPAVPVDAVSGIVDAFQSHRLVALAEGVHNNEPGHAFRLSLIRDPRFSAAVTDVVVEFGNARYQSTIEREVLAKNRRALVIYGDGHLARRDILQNFAPSPFLVPQLEAAGARVFTIFFTTDVDLSHLQGDIAAWRRPSLAILRGTVLGSLDTATFLPEGGPRFTPTGDGPDFSRPLPKSEWRTWPMEDQFDAVLYVGPTSDTAMSQLSKRLCNDADYLTMRVQRMTWAGMQRQVDRLRQYCATTR